MTVGLPLSDIVDVQVTLGPTAAATRNFGTLLILGDSAKIPDASNAVLFSDMASVGETFDATDPEYLAAEIFFSQSPQPSTLYIANFTHSDSDDLNALKLRVNNLVAAASDWYGLAIAMTKMPPTSDVVGIGSLIESYNPPRTLWATTQEIGAVHADSTNDLAYLLNAANLSRTWCQYSTSSPYAAVSAFARIATVDYTGQNTTITLKFKNEPTITGETLTSDEYAALAAKKCNVFALLQNGDSIIQEGYMADGTWADTRIGCDAFQNALQTAGFNLLYSSTKIPQTDAGMTTIKAAYDGVCQTFVANGMFAPGVWTGPGIGAIKTGDTLNDGYYIYKPSVASQSAADRAARKAVVMQIACKLAGAVHSSDVLVNVVN